MSAIVGRITDLGTGAKPALTLKPERDLATIAVVETSDEQAADLFAAYATGVAFRVELSMPQIRALRQMRDAMHRDPEQHGKMERFDGGYGLSTTRALMNKGLATFRNRKHVPTSAGIAVLTLVDMARIHSSSNNSITGG